jgi:signal transduction histidine kinase
VAATAAGNPLAPRLDTLVRQAQATLAEGRDKIAGLRAQHDAAPAFAAALGQAAAAILEGSTILLASTCRGTPWRFSDRVAGECHAIAAEAIGNACKHAQAKTVRIDVRYRWTGCTITIADDGRGIAPEHLAGRLGHWGLAGMRERAALIKARIDIATGPSGTTVRLHVGRGAGRR